MKRKRLNKNFVNKETKQKVEEKQNQIQDLLNELKFFCADVLSIILEYNQSFLLYRYIELVTQGINAVTMFPLPPASHSFFAFDLGKRHYPSYYKDPPGITEILRSDWMKKIENLSLKESCDDALFLIVKDEFNRDWAPHLKKLQEHWYKILEVQVPDGAYQELKFSKKYTDIAEMLVHFLLQHKNNHTDSAEMLVHYSLQYGNYRHHLNSSLRFFLPIFGLLGGQLGLAWLLFFFHLNNKIHNNLTADYSYNWPLSKDTQDDILECAIYLSSNCIRLKSEPYYKFFQFYPQEVCKNGSPFMFAGKILNLQ